MRVALLGIVHESNTFVDSKTGLEQFRKGHWLFGQGIVDEYRHAFHEVGGMIEAIEAAGIELVPVMYAEATPGGKVTKEAFEHLMNEMFNALKIILPVDGILVVPHGAGVCEAYDDMDGHWLERLRKHVGPAIPIIGTIDPHANLSKKMIEATNALVAYKTNPHVDQRNVGQEAGSLMAEVLLGHVKPVQLFSSLPLAISIEQQLTDKDPCKHVLQMAKEMECREGILSISLVLGFPYADVEDMGASLIVVADGDTAVAQKAMAELEAYMMVNRQLFNGAKQDISALMNGWDGLRKPILLLDMGDNVGGGAPGDSSYLTDQLEDAGKRNSFACIHDPAAVITAFGHATGDSFDLVFGQRPDHVASRSRQVKLIWKGSGTFDETTPRHGGQVHFEMGNTAIVKTAHGHTIMLSTLRVPPYSLRQMTAFGLDPASFETIIAKGVNAPIAAYTGICPTILQVNTPGLTTADMTRFHYEKRRVPLFPFEAIIHQQ